MKTFLITIVGLVVTTEACFAQIRSLNQVGLYHDSAAVGSVETERSTLVYSIGTVEKMIRGAALIDLGDLHTLSVAAPKNKVALFRSTAEKYVPVGVLKISETYSTYSLAFPAPGVKPEAGDVVMFVREISQLKSADNHRDDFIKQQLVKNAYATGYSTVRRFETAKVMRTYFEDHRKWERSRANIGGFLNGESFASGREQSLKPLLNYLGMLREDFRIGRNSLTASGKKWTETSRALFGATVMTQHAAAQNVEFEDPVFADQKRPPDRDIQREVGERFFDRSEEQKNTLSYIVAALLEANPRNDDAWFHRTILQTQFPELGEETFVLEQIREILKTLQEDQ